MEVQIRLQKWLRKIIDGIESHRCAYCNSENTELERIVKVKYCFIAYIYCTECKLIDRPSLLASELKKLFRSL